MKLALSLVASMCAAPLATAGQVWVVGPAPAPYQDLQDTIILAQAGDIVLVRPGTYESIRMVGRSVTVVADNGLPVSLSGGIRVIDVPAPNTVVVSGMRAHSANVAGFAESSAALYMEHCGGQVLVQDCVFGTPIVYNPWQGTWPVFGLPDRASVRIKNCAGLSAVRCVASSGYGSDSPAIRIRFGSHVSLWGVTALGSTGGDAVSLYGDGGFGNPGLLVTAPGNEPASEVFVTGGLMQGGQGGGGTYFPFFQCGFGGAGGHGIDGQNPNGLVRLLGVLAIGGLGGQGANQSSSAYCSGPCDGSDGMPIYAPPFAYWHPSYCQYQSPNTLPGTSHTLLPGTPRALNGPRIVRDSVPSALLGASGTPGELVEVATSQTQLTFENRPAEFGVLGIPKAKWRRAGVVPANGTLGVRFSVPDLPLSDPGATYLIQARFTDPATNQVRLSNVHALVVVDATY